MQSWETDDGLPHNSILSIVQGADGFLWIATNGGLVRFDGVSFVESRSALLADDTSASIREVIEEAPGTLLVASAKSGLVRVRAGSCELHPATAHLPRGQRVHRLFLARDGALWIAFFNREIMRWAPEAVARFAPPQTPWPPWPVTFAQGASGDVHVSRGNGLERYADGALHLVDAVPARPCSVAKAKDGAIWIFTEDTLGKLRDDALEVIDRSARQDGTPPEAMLETADGAIWLAYARRGLKRFRNGRFEDVATSHSRVSSLCEDDEGNVWAGTVGGGLNRLQPARFAVLSDEAPWAATTFGSVTVDTLDHVWTSNQNGLRRHDGTRHTVMSDLAGWPRKTTSVCADQRGRIWIAAGSALWRADAGSEAPPTLVDESNPHPIRSLLVAADQSVWAGREGGEVERYAEGQSQRFSLGPQGPADACAALAQDAEGTLWIGTNKGRLFMLRAGQAPTPVELAGLSTADVRCLYADAAGTLWIATGGAGLLVRHQGRLHRLKEEDGLPDTVLSQIVEDGLGNLWFGSRRGIFRVSKAGLLDRIAGRAHSVYAIHFGRADGLSGISALAGHPPVVWRSSTGLLWFSTRRGLVSADPGRVARTMPPLRVCIDRVAVDGRELEGPGRSVPPGARRVDFVFTAPTFSAPDRVVFRHRLDAVDAGWVESGGQRRATYSALRPGRYRFSVTAGRGDGQWGPAEASFSFEVKPAWWETWWARAAGLSGLLIALTVGVRHGSQRRLKRRLSEIEQQQRVAKERTRIARDLHDDLGASLTQATLMAEELGDHSHDAGWVGTHSRRVADQIRAIARDLDAVVWSASPRNDSLKSLCSYLCQYSTEYFRGTGVRCLIDVPEQIPATVLLPEVRHHLFMVAKEALNNVLKHSGATQVEVSIQVADDHFELSIRDNGRGFSPEAIVATQRQGLGNVRSRMAELGGTCEVEARPGNGVRVVVRTKLGMLIPL